MSLSKVLEVARAELGQTESPRGSNRIKYWDEYDPAWQGQPWCVAFLWWVFRHAGEGAAIFAGAKTASCGTLLRWYQAQGQTVPVKDIRRGDIVILNFRGTTDTQHCGLVVDVQHLRGALLSITTIEGNTTPGLEGSQDNGGSVALKTRHPAQIVAVCRPQYQPEPAAVPKDYEGRWSEPDMRWADEAGIMRGYDDGTYRPKQNLTREEFAAMLHRYHQKREAGEL